MDSNLHVAFNEEDLPFEEELLRNPKSLKAWLRYIEARQASGKRILNMIYERAVKELPGSYKLWYNYLKLRRKQLKGRCITDPAFDETNNAFERSLVFMHKMPRIWMDYSSFLVEQKKITRARRVMDRALRALPITQHDRIWPIYIKFVKGHDIPETAVRVFRRYLQLCPENMEEYVDYLLDIGRLDEAAVNLAKIVNQQGFISKKGKSNHALWYELCELISKNPHDVTSLDVDAIIRGGLRRYTDQVGHLWNSLADYYIRSGLFERARDIYEEAISTVTTVRDFTQIFDAYAQFEELALEKKIKELEILEKPTKTQEIQCEMFMARYENLMERRPLLLNSVLLRQNPHNVPEWQKRITLLEGRPHEIIQTYTESVQTVDPKQAIGKLHTLWVNFAKFYEENDQLDDARIIFEKGTHVAYLKVEELAGVWCEWVEMELRHDNHTECLKLLQRATAPPPRKVAYHDSGETVQMRLHKSLKVWSLYADMEESFGTFKSTKAVYDRIIDLKIATPQIIINYGLFLKENNYFEEAFKAYEKGISLFKWPNVFDIWNQYLTEFLARYGGSKLERARDLFEQCLEDCPEKFCKPIFVLYAQLEEKYGMAHHAMSVYDRAIDKVDPKERFGLFNIYLKKAAEIYGVTRTRQIYEKAIEVLNDREARDMGQRFADLETKLGEIDRARHIYAHCSDMCDPRTTPDFWQKWRDFEVKHGNEDTLREMLRIKRSVQHKYNTQVNMMSAQMLASGGTGGTVADLAPGMQDDMRLLETKALQMQQKNSAGNVSFVRGEAQSKAVEEAAKSSTANPDEIDLDETDDESEAEEETEITNIGKVEKQVIPTEVFGGLKKDDSDD